ncbi:MAG: MATE family efflux transporter [Oscillospiraceae bacterium]|nr:MATE family efflux transporter [Oscillospiraceae bacterium]
MDKSRFWKKLIPLVFPIAFEQLMYSLVSASDALMLGLVDQASLSSVSLATQVAFVFYSCIGGMTAGGNILLAQYWGKGSIEQVEQVFAILVRPVLLVCALLSAATMFVPEMIMRFFTPDPELIHLGAQYLRMVSPYYLLNGISQCYQCAMKNCGRAAKASLISSIGVGLNIALNAILIFGLLGAPEMGIRGAALATVISQSVLLAWVLTDTIRFSKIQLRRKQLFNFHQPLERDYWKYTVPVLANYLVWGLGITMGSMILGHLGTDAVAANSIASVAKNLIACFCMGLAAGGAILVGNELGAGELERAKQYGSKVVVMAVISGAISGAILVALTPVILKVAELSDQAAEYLRWMIIVCAVNIIGMSHNSATISGIFCAGGDTKFGFICDAITLWLIVVPCGLVGAFVLHLPVPVVYILISMDEIIKLPAVWMNYKKYKWVRDLTKPQETV